MCYASLHTDRAGSWRSPSCTAAPLTRSGLRTRERNLRPAPRPLSAVLLLVAITLDTASSRIIGSELSDRTEIQTQRHLLLDSAGPLANYSFSWRLEVTVAIQSVPDHAGESVATTVENTLSDSKSFAKLHNSDISEICQDTHTNSIQVEKGTQLVFSTALYQCTRALVGAGPGTYEYLALGEQRSMVAAINRGWEPLKEAIANDLAAGGTMSELQPIMVKDATLEATVLAESSGSGAPDPVMELRTISTEELATAQTTLADVAASSLSAWEITAVVVASLVAVYVAYTIGRFMHERHIIQKQRFYLQASFSTVATPRPPSITEPRRTNGWMASVPNTDSPTAVLGDSAGSAAGFGNPLRRPMNVFRASAPLNTVGSSTRGEALGSDPGPANRADDVQPPHSPGASDLLPCYSYSQLSAACNGFSENAVIGSGGFGNVYMGCLNHTPIAVKVLRDGGTQGAEEFLAEVELLSSVCHPNVAILLGCCREPGHQCLVYELLINGSLQALLDQSSGRAPLPWQVRLSIAIDITRALCFLHGHPTQIIMHHDLKPANVLLDDRYTAKVSDVGLARIASRGSSAGSDSGLVDRQRVGTPAYTDDEYRETGHFTPACDVYALGVSLMQVLTAMPPNGLPEIVRKSLATKKLSSLMDISDPRAGQWPLSLLRQLFELSLRCTEDRQDRPSLNDIMQELQGMMDLARDLNHR